MRMHILEPPQTLNLIYCRKCGAIYYIGRKRMLNDGDMVELVEGVRTKCSRCENLDVQDKRINRANR